MQDWNELIKIAGDNDFTVSKIKLKEKDISIEGDFELSPLGKLSYDDQVFIAGFIKVHGSIKQMEELFGVSYPTIKAKLNKISNRLQFIEINHTNTKEETLALLEKGLISAEEALERLKK